MKRIHSLGPGLLGIVAVGCCGGCSLLDSRNTFEPTGSFAASAEAFRLEFVDVPAGAGLGPEALRAPEEVFRAGPGDVLRIEVADVEDTEATTVVMPDGMLYYDAAEGLPASGKTLAELEEALAERLRDLYPEPVVVISPVQARSRQYGVLGQVQRPGVYPLDRPTTVLDALSLAGGVRSSQIGDRTVNLADFRRSVLLRGETLVPVDFERLVEQGDMSQNVYLRAEDMLVLPAKGQEKVFVLGNANRPGAVPYSSDLTFIKAIASAGGPVASSYKAGVLLLRGMDTPEPKVARVDLNDLLHRGGLNFPLRPGDVIWIPRAPWEKLAQYSRVAMDSALTTIAIQQAEESFGTDSAGAGGNDVVLGIASGPEREDP